MQGVTLGLNLGDSPSTSIAEFVSLGQKGERFVAEIHSLEFAPYTGCHSSTSGPIGVQLLPTAEENPARHHFSYDSVPGASEIAYENAEERTEK